MKNATEQMIKHINGKYNNECYWQELGLNVANTMNGLSVFKKNWFICTAEELDEMIQELEWLKEVITIVEERTSR